MGKARVELLSLVLAGLCACVPAMPPPAHYVPLEPLSTNTTPSASAGVALGIPPQLGGGWSAPLPGAPRFVFDAGGQLGPTSLLASGGIMARTRPQEHSGFHLGLRLGGMAGTGDLLGVTKFRMPYAGIDVWGQLAWGFAKPMGGFAVNVGLQGSTPLTAKEYSYTEDDGDVVYVPPLPGIYGSLDARVDIPVGQSAAFFVGGGLDMPWFAGIFPRAALGLRWSPSTATPPSRP